MSKNTIQQTETKDSFVFYRSYFEALSDLAEEQQIKLYFAISNYSLNFIEPKLDGVCKTVWTLIKPQVDANRKKWKNGKKSKNGGRPRKEKPIGFISENPNENVNYNVNENENNNERMSNAPTHSHFLNFDFYKTDYTDLPIELQTTIQSNDWNTWQVFNQHMDKECKRIRQIPEQMNFEDYLEYKDRYIKSGLFDALKLKTMLSKFNNHKSNQKYLSVYVALIDWTERELTYLKVV